MKKKDIKIFLIGLLIGIVLTLVGVRILDLKRDLAIDYQQDLLINDQNQNDFESTSSAIDATMSAEEDQELNSF